jgi:hypothetical protein
LRGLSNTLAASVGEYRWILLQKTHVFIWFSRSNKQTHTTVTSIPQLSTRAHYPKCYVTN